MDEELEFAGRLAQCLCGLNISLVSGDAESVGKLLAGSCLGEPPEKETAERLARGLRQTAPGAVYDIRAAADIRFCSLYIPERRRYLLAGPFSETPFDSRAASGFCSRTREDTDRRFAEDASRIPVIRADRVSRFCMLAAERCFRICGQPDAIRPGLSPADAPYGRPEAAGEYEDPEKIRSIESRYEFSGALTEAVKQGNTALALRMVSAGRSIADELVRNPDPLRNAKNICIVLNTQLRCAMEDIGIHPYRLDSVSGQIGTRIEKLQSLPEVRAFVPGLIRTYCSLARERAYPGLTPFCRPAVAYIMTHLSDSVTVKSAAKALAVNPNYLSSRFRRDTGMTFIAFLNRERARQAAALLSGTGMQIQQIAAACGYNNSSYFARQFAVYSHMTPREYRARARSEAEKKEES